MVPRGKSSFDVLYNRSRWRGLLTCVVELRSEDKLNWNDAKETLLSARLYVHYLTYLSISVGVASLSLFAPTIIAGLGYTDIQAQLFTVPPYAVAYVVTLGLAWLSDRLKCRGAIACGSQIAAAVAFIIQGKQAHLLNYSSYFSLFTSSTMLITY